MSVRRQMSFRLAAAMALGAAALGLASCGGTSRSPTKPHAVSAGVRGADTGLELHWWIVVDDLRAIAAAFEPYMDQSIPAPESRRNRWHDNGLRLLSIPTADVDSLSRQLPIIGPIERQWLGQRPAWTDAVRGPHLREGGLVSLDSGDVMLPPGRLRLLIRCWAMPMPAPDGAVPAGLRVELAPQYADSTAPDSRIELDTGLRVRLRTEEEGMVFTNLVLEMIAVEGRAILIVPESPRVDWSNPPPADAPEPVGPAFHPPPSLGEAMLTLPGRSLNQTTGARAVIVLVPRTPERFKLIRDDR